MTTESLKIGESLKKFRATFHLKQGDVAKAVGILPQLYYKYESGKVTPSSNVLYKLAKHYGVSADYLLGLSENPSPTDKELLEAVISCHEILNGVLENQGANSDDNLQNN